MGSVAVLVSGLLMMPWAVAVDEAVQEDSEPNDKADATATEQPLTVEELLTRDPQRSEYVKDARCITSARIKDTIVIDDRHIAFRVSRDEYYLVQFDHRCHDLRRGRPVAIERQSIKLCVNDSVRGIRDYGGGAYRRGMRCRIPGFQRISKEQLDLLEATLREQKNR